MSHEDGIKRIGPISVHSEGRVLELRIEEPSLFGPDAHEILWLAVCDAVDAHPPETQVIIDFKNVKHVTSSTISVLVRIRRYIKQESKRLGLFGMNSNVRNVFKMMRLDGKVFLIFDTKDEVLQYLNEHPLPSSARYRRPHAGSDIEEL